MKKKDDDESGEGAQNVPIMRVGDAVNALVRA
jgi:hypothetical protein